jgi:UDP-glucose 4-epimerase
MVKALVTGGAGFIGSHLVSALVARGNKVVVVDDLSLGKRENVHHDAKFVQRSIADKLDDLFIEEEFERVYHVAALARVQLSIAEPARTHNANVNGTLNLLEMCKKFNVRRFVFSSSSSIYGDQDKLPLVETMAPNPMSPYAAHKLMGEIYCKIYKEIYGLETVALRYFNVYGGRMDPNGDYALLIPRFADKMFRGVQPVINGDGEQTRDFTYAGDVVAANILAGSTQDARCFGQAFNIGGGKNHSVNYVEEQIAKIAGNGIRAVRGKAVIEPKNTLADIRKAKEILGWEPRVKFEDGLKEAVEWFKPRA